MLLLFLLYKKSISAQLIEDCLLKAVTHRDTGYSSLGNQSGYLIHQPPFSRDRNIVVYLPIPSILFNDGVFLDVRFLVVIVLN